MVGDEAVVVDPKVGTADGDPKEGEPNDTPKDGAPKEGAVGCATLPKLETPKAGCDAGLSIQKSIKERRIQNDFPSASL